MPKPVFTGIPRGATHNGGRLAFASDRTLYVGTGDTANPALPADPTSLAGKVLRLDEFGKPAEGNPTAASPIFASGFTQVTGMCTLDDGTVAALDQRSTQDVLLPLTAGHDYTTLAPGDARWTWTAADGRAADCAVSGGLLASTSLDKQQLTGIQMGSGGTFTGTPTVILDNRYGRLLTVTADTQGLLWLTTSNKDGVRHTGAQRRPRGGRPRLRRRRRGRPRLTPGLTWPGALVARIKNDGAAEMVDSCLTRPTSGTFIRAGAQQRDRVGRRPQECVGELDQTRPD